MKVMRVVDLLKDKGELQAQLDNMADAELPLFEITDMMRLELDGNTSVNLPIYLHYCLIL